MMSKANLFKTEQAFIDGLAAQGGKPLYELTPAEARQVLLKVQDTAYELPDVEFETAEIDTAGGRRLEMLIVRPKGTTGDLGVIYYIHGGGWVMGDETTHQRLIAELAADVPAAVVFPIYRQAPEGHFPEVTEDLYRGLLYIAEFGGTHGINPHHLAVAGDSVGGNMAALMTLAAKENGFTPRICFQLLMYPVTAADFDTGSYQAFADGPWLTKKAMKWFWNQYLPDEEKRRDPEVSPLHADIEDLCGLPPALVITDENDVLRDEGEEYARKLDKAGVLTAAVRFMGTLHDFMVLNALKDSPVSRAAMSLIKEELRRYLYGTK